MDCLCAGCHQPMPIHPRQRNPRRYCSGVCRSRLLRGWSPKRRECERCGTAFITASSIKRYCSARCGWLHRSGAQWRIIECRVCATTFTTNQPLQVYCGARCRKAWKDRSSRRSSVGQATRRRVLDRDGWRCYLCRGRIERRFRWPHPRSGTVDHVIPASAGGSDRLSNLRAAHWHCNEEKGDKLPGVEFWVPMEAA